MFHNKHNTINNNNKIIATNEMTIDNILYRYLYIFLKIESLKCMTLNYSFFF